MTTSSAKHSVEHDYGVITFDTPPHAVHAFLADID